MHSNDRQRITFQGSSEASMSQYRFVSGAADLRIHRSRLALHLRVDAYHTRDAPNWRGVSYGGGSVLRGAPIARWRAPFMSAAIMEWRQPIVPLLSVAIFGETAWAGDVHWGGEQASGFTYRHGLTIRCVLTWLMDGTGLEPHRRLGRRLLGRTTPTHRLQSTQGFSVVLTR